MDDLEALDATSSVKWVPKDPRELLLPYLPKEEELEESDIDKRRRKSKEVYDGYTELEEECATLKQEIENQCKNAKVTINPAVELNVMSAIQRTFGTDGKEITFEMYKKALEQLHEISNSNIPKGKL